MKARYKISGLVLLFLIAVFFLVKFQARRIITSLIESNSNGQVVVDIGRINIHPVNSSIRLKSISVLVKDPESSNFKKATIDRVFLDVESLWDFFSGGTLVIEKFECTNADLTIYNYTSADTTAHTASLNEVVQRIKTDAVRFRIKDMVFSDINLFMLRDSAKAPVAIRHMYARAQNLFLSADSILKEKPIIEFNLPAQEVKFPSELTVGFDSLAFTTRDNSIQLLNLKLKSPPSAASRAYFIQSEKVRVTQFSFDSLYTKGKVDIDSVFLGKALVTVDWAIAHNGEKSKSKQRIPALPQMHIRNITFKEIVSDVTIRNDSVKNTFKIERASLIIERFQHNPDSSRVIYSPYYNLLITKYSTFLGSNNTSLSFDTIQIQKRSLSLLNFSYKTADQEQPLIQTPRFELKQVDWYEFLINRKLIADEVLAMNPTIITTIKPKEGDSKPFDNFKIIGTLNEFFRVNLFSLRNASAFVKVPAKNMDVVLYGYNSTIKVRELINSGSVSEGVQAINDLSFKTLSVTNPDFNLHVSDFRFDGEQSLLKAVAFDNTKSVVLNLDDVRLGAFAWSESNSFLRLDGISWVNLKAEIKGSNLEQTKSKSKESPKLRVTDIRGGQANVLYSKDDLRLKILLDKLNLDSLNSGDSITFSGLDVTGNSLLLDSKLNDLRVGNFAFTDHGGAINNIWFNRNTKEYLNVAAGAVSFKANVPDFARQKYILQELTLDMVKANFNKRDSTHYLDIAADTRLFAKDIRFDNKSLMVSLLDMDVGPFAVTSERRVKNELHALSDGTKADMRRLRSSADSVMRNDYSLKTLRQTSRRLKMNAVDNDTARFIFKLLKVKSDKGNVKFSVSKIRTAVLDSSMHVKASVNKIQFSEVDFATDELIAWINEGSLNNLIIDSERDNSALNLLESNYRTAGIQKMKGRVEVNGNIIRFDQLDYHPKTFSGTIKDFEFRPLKDRQQFLDDSHYQTNYLSTRIQSIAFNKFDVKRFLEDTVIHLSSIHVLSPDLEIGRDKTHPFFATEIKPLPTNAFQKLRVDFKIDTLKVTDGSIAYTEKSRITGQDGTIGFSKLNALVRNVKNIELNEDDSMHIEATTRFMDSAKVKLRVRESYRDTLGGFLLATQVSPFHTSILNKALVPMVSVDFKSGFVDTLYMRAIGREYVSLGSMKFLYHDLKVEFLDKNDTARHSVKNQLLKFAANTFVIRTNNKDRIGKIYYERDRNRAVFQYWVKMILSGVTTSVGAKSNKKQIRKYMKKLNQKRLPSIKGEFDL